MKKVKKIGITLLKIGVSFLLLYWVFKKIPFREVWGLIVESNFVYLTLALVAFVFSQVVSSLRLVQFLEVQNYHLSKITNWKLYLIGMFYNFFIPGGIGGDAYKIYILNKKFQWNVKKLTSAIFSDRLVGLMAIVVLIQIFAIALFETPWKWALLGTAFISVIGGFFFFKLFFKTYQSIFTKTFLYSIGVQLLQVFSVFCILKAIAPVDSVWIYLVVFLLSAILSLISFSGIGVREWLFMKAAVLYHFDPQISVSAALVFTIMTAFVSLFGIWYQNRNIFDTDSL